MDDTGSTHTLVDKQILTSEMKTKIRPWISGSLEGVMGLKFTPSGRMDNVEIVVGNKKTIIDNVAVLEKNAVPVLLGDTWREKSEVKTKSYGGRICYKTFDGSTWRCLQPTEKQIDEHSMMVSSLQGFSGICTSIQADKKNLELMSNRVKLKEDELNLKGNRNSVAKFTIGFKWPKKKMQ